MQLLILASALASGFGGGAFLALSSFVMKSLAPLPVPQGIAAMQSINAVVINPLFMGALLGTGLLCIGLLVTST